MINDKHYIRYAYKGGGGCKWFPLDALPTEDELKDLEYIGEGKENYTLFYKNNALAGSLYIGIHKNPGTVTTPTMPYIYPENIKELRDDWKVHSEEFNNNTGVSISKAQLTAIAANMQEGDKLYIAPQDANIKKNWRNK